MRYVKRSLFLLLFLLSPLFAYGGFVAGTVVKTPDGYTPIEQLSTGSLVCSVDQDQVLHISKVEHVVSYQATRAIHFEVSGEVIIAAPSQKFYMHNYDAWFKAKDIMLDDVFCGTSVQELQVQNIFLEKAEVELFDIQLDEVHTFCVTKHDIIVHNFPPFVVGVSFAFGGGVSFQGISASLCIAGIWIGSKILKCDKQKGFEAEIVVSPNLGDEPITQLQDNATQGVQAPGRPTEDDGFIPKKNWDGRKVKHPKTGQVGWPDKKGSVWVPSGPSGHGGPHWDVISKDGKEHWNIVPGGRKRGLK